MVKLKNEELLSDDRVQQEVNRHRWIESEKAGTDIGFEKAARDWLNRFSDGWLQYYGVAKAPKATPKRSAKAMAKK